MNFLAKLFLFFFLSFSQIEALINIVKRDGDNKMNCRFLLKDRSASNQVRIEGDGGRLSSFVLTPILLYKNGLIKKSLYAFLKSLDGVDAVMRIIAFDFFINDYLLHNLSPSSEKLNSGKFSALISLGIFTNIFVKRIVEKFFPSFLNAFLTFQYFDLEVVFDYLSSVFLFDRFFYENKLECPIAFGFLHIGDQQGFSFGKLSIFNDLLIIFKKFPDLAIEILNMGEGELCFTLNQLFPDGGFDFNRGSLLGEYRFFFDKENFIGYEDLFKYLLSLQLITS